MTGLVVGSPVLGSLRETLDLWESFVDTTPPARGAAVVVARGLARDVASACELPLAVTARESLAELRDRVGPKLDTVLTCPACEALLDVPLPLDAVLAGHDDAAEAEVGGVTLRAPTTADVLAALDSADAAATLRARCVTWPAGTDPARDPVLAARVADAAERLAGVAGASVRVQCPECGGDVTADVDVVWLLTEHVTEQAHGLLTDVATMAAAFGWTEPEVLALSPARFQAYLDLARARV